MEAHGNRNGMHVNVLLQTVTAAWQKCGGGAASDLFSYANDGKRDKKKVERKSSLIQELF